ncbi:MAG: response regulator [Bacteroidia bacterium]
MTNAIKILVVEDDPIIAEDLQAYMEDFGYQGLTPAESADVALKRIKKDQPDLCLLDVHLKGEINGIQLAKLIQAEWDMPIIFLTAFNDRTTIDQIKEIKPAGYLVKPVEERNLQTAIEIALARVHSEEEKETSQSSSVDAVFIKIKDRLAKFSYDDILYFEAYDNYAFLHTTDKKHILSSSLKQLEDKLASANFIRTHRSYIVNVDKVSGIFTNYLTIGKREIPIGKTFREHLMKRIATL